MLREYVRQECLAVELDKCGSQKERMTQQIEETVKGTKARIEALIESIRVEEEKRKEMKEKAIVLLGELEKLVELGPPPAYVNGHQIANPSANA